MADDSLNNFSTESAEELYENAPCGYISFRADGTIFRINNTLLHWLEYAGKKEVLEVKKIQDLFRIGGKIYFETHFFPLVKMQGFVKEINFDLVRKDGSFFPALINVNQVEEGTSGKFFYRASVLDITDRKKYERVLLDGKAKAEKASRAKAEFLSTISHEIRTPLNAIVGIGNLIQKTSLDDLQKEYARILQLSSANLLELVNNLLDLSKLEAHKVKLEERIFSLNQLLEVLIHSFKVRANEKKIELKKDIPTSLPDHLVGDPVKLNQILTNLLGNAIKFTGKGYVKLKIEETKRSDKSVSLHFTVCDTGIGIPSDKLQIIFQEFSQASYDVNLEYGGTGLGLTISQKLLQMHGSELMVESKEGKGSEFSFILNFQISKETAPVRKKESRLAELLAASGARILVVDDNKVNLFITSQYLRDWGLVHETADSGEAAKLAVENGNFDIILMDLHMPKMNGYEASSAIRKICLDPQPVIIALSASGRGDVSLKMKRAGIDAYVPKPFDPTELQEVMMHFLSGKKGEPANKEHKPVIANQQIPSGSAETRIPAAPVNLQRYLELAKDNPAIFDKLVKNSIESMEKLRKEISEVNFEKSDLLDGLIHKNTMTLHYLDAQRLTKLLKDFRKLLQDEVNEQELPKIKRNVIEEIDQIVESLQRVDLKQLR